MNKNGKFISAALAIVIAAASVTVGCDEKTEEKSSTPVETVQTTVPPTEPIL